MNLVDMHCDTAWKLFEGRRGETLEENECSVNLKQLKRAGSLAQFFACFVDVGRFPSEQYAKGYERVKELMHRMKREVECFEDKIAFAGNYAELMEHKNAGKISAILTVEEGGVTEGKLSRVTEFYDEGIRLITLLWNYENCIGYPNSRNATLMQKGLKPFGFELVEKMNELGMLIDVSHMSDGGFWDVIKQSKTPVVASHSNARALCSHPRNLTDEMLRALAEKGGVAGVNFYPAFIREDMSAKAEDIVCHIRHMVNVGGSDAVAIGTDFDGFSGGELEIENIGEIELLYDALRKNGFSGSQIEKIWSGNALRIIREIL